MLLIGIWLSGALSFNSSCRRCWISCWISILLVRTKSHVRILWSSLIPSILWMNTSKIIFELTLYAWQTVWCSFATASAQLSWASITNTSAPQPPKIKSDSKVESKKSICPGKSQIWNCTKLLFEISTTVSNKMATYHSWQFCWYSPRIMFRVATFFGKQLFVCLIFHSYAVPSIIFLVYRLNSHRYHSRHFWRSYVLFFMHF